MRNTAMQQSLAEAEGPSCLGSPQPLGTRFAQAAHKYQNNTAVASLYQQNLPALPVSSSAVNENLKWTYQQLDEAANLLAAALYDRGTRRGMCIAAFLFNSAEWALLFWSSLKLGAIFVPLDARSVSRQEEVQHYLKVVKPAVLVVGDDPAAETFHKNNDLDLPASTLRVVASSDRPVQDGWTSLHDILVEARTSKTRVEQIEAAQNEVMNDVVLIVFTSGTSGFPKACPHTNMSLWTSCEAASSFRSLGPDDSAVQHLPPSHSFACLDMVQCWSAGAAIFYPAKSFDAKTTLEAIESFECTYMSAIPGLLLALIAHPSFTPQKTKSLRQIALGSTVISPDILALAADPMKIGAKEVMAGFGMSEVLPVFVATTKRAAKAQNGCLGLDVMLPGSKIRICDPESRKVLRRGEVGELHVGGSGVIDGYAYGDNKVFYDDENGHWIATGDQAKMEVDGTLYVMGRYKDIIIRAGENLSPALIETCLNKAGVMAQVVGIPDPIAGELPVAVVQPLRPGPLPLNEMQKLVQTAMGPQNAPVAYLALQDLGLQAFPTTTSGKVRKDQLKAIVTKHLSGQITEDNVGAQTAGTSLDSTERLLVQAIAQLTGQPAETVPLDNPLTSLTDSVTILRLQAHVRNRTGKNITAGDVLRAPSVRELAELLGKLPDLDHGNPSSATRESPPTTSEMVHTQGEHFQTLRTKLVTEPLLAKLGMSWSDVEDVFPIPDLSSRCFESTRPTAYSLRMSLVASSASRSRLRTALEATLQQWPTFRVIAVKLDQQALFVSVRAGSKWTEAAITEVTDLATPQDLCSLTLPDSEKNYVHPRNGGPLTRFAVANIKSTGTAGLMILANHSPHDAISLQAFTQDLSRNLAGDSVPETRTPYKMFADTYFQYSSSLPSQLAVAFHVTRLRGISSLRETCWPRQRCVGWHIGDDAGYTVPALADPTLPTQRTQVDNDGGHAGLVGIQKYARLQHLSDLRAKHNIAAPVLFKAACALANSHLACSREVLFANTQAGRQWPFLDPAITTHLPNPVTVAGNTLSTVVNRVQIHPLETVGSFLARLEAEQHLLTTHAHAPTAAITSQLNPGDAAAFLAGRRQLLNWNPSLAEAGGAETGEISVVQVVGFTEVVLEWHCGVLKGDVASVLVRWDGCQAGKMEVEGWGDQFIKALLWVAGRENWDSRIEELVCEGVLGSYVV